MPNHVTTQLKIVGITSEIESLKLTVMGDTPFDFNSITPMPRELRTVTSPVQIVTEEQYQDEVNQIKSGTTPFLNTHGITKEMQEKYLSKFGFDNWYTWALNNWGTKWNCYEIVTPTISNILSEKRNIAGRLIGMEKESVYTVSFKTAWSIPLPVILKLSKMYPKLTVKVTFADEDAGYNCGKLTVIDGSVIDGMSVIPEGRSDKAMEIYFEVNPQAKREYKKVNGKYEYVG